MKKLEPWHNTLIEFGFKRMDENFNGDTIPIGLEKWHLYLRYVLVIEIYYNRFYLLNWMGDTNGPCYNIDRIDDIKNIYAYAFREHEINDMKSSYRDYQLNRLV